MESQEDQIGMYGFKTNVRSKPSDVVVRINFFEKILHTSYSITFRKLIIISLIYVIILLSFSAYLTSNFVRLPYIVFGNLLLLSGSGLLLSQLLFTNAFTGTLMKSSILFALQQWDRLLIHSRRKQKFKKIGIKGISKDNMIVFSNGEVGRIYEADGFVSSTLFPEEVRHIEKEARNYNRSRGRNCVEIKITSSQRQNTEIQQENLRKMYAKNVNIKGIADICQQQKQVLEQYVEGKKLTVIQHIVLRGSSERALLEHEERLFNYVKRGLYYKIRTLGKEEQERYLVTFHNLK
ncbi:hypothetical protein HB968_14320 [Listeria welshimeri]|nr:hypothetical protein [Listeria welshimeri]